LREGSAIDIRSLLDVFRPIHDLWWAIFGETVSFGLNVLYHAIASVPFLQTMGAYGLAIVVLTILIKTVLSPLYHFQLSVSRRSMLEQRKIAPELAELRKKYKNDPQKQQAAMMELYKEHGINPLGGLTGCIPALLQLPILTALYYVFYGNARAHRYPSDHFLWIQHLNDFPSAHPLIPGLPIPTLAYLVIPLLAAATTFVQSRMMQQPPNPMATEQEQQAQQMTRTMQVVMPLMIAYFAFVTPAGLGLYWLVSNCFAIIQQYFVTGWGGLLGHPPVGPTTGREGAARGPAANGSRADRAQKSKPTPAAAPRQAPSRPRRARR